MSPRPLDISPASNPETPTEKYATSAAHIADVARNAKEEAVQQNLDRLQKAGDALYYETYGAWSNHHLAKEIIARCGASRVWIKSYNFTRSSAELFAHLKKEGAITYLHATLDHRMVTAESKSYGVLTEVTDVLHLTSNHAKLLLVVGDNDSYLVSNSANFTENRRNENGLIVRQPNNLSAIIKAVEHDTKRDADHED